MRRAVVTMMLAVGLPGVVGVEAAHPAAAAPSSSYGAHPEVVQPLRAFLASVSCPTTTSCFAVGSNEPKAAASARIGGPPAHKTLVEHWNGSNWSIVASPNPSDAQTSDLSSVSCATTTSCFAVGNYVTDYAHLEVNKALVEHWNGRKWSIVASPRPSGSSGEELNGVSCPSTTSCFAVGTSGDTSNATLLEHWDGRGWSIMPSPGPNPATSPFLNAVSCSTSTSCSAVGAYYPSALVEATLVEHWDGTTWSVVPSANPSSTAVPILTDVSCPGTTSCVAVGYSYESSSVQHTFVERWNGTAWSIVASPTPSGATYLTLSGVSCPATSSCFAVGSYSIAATTRPLVEHWNGTDWSIAASPNVSGSASPPLHDVSCRSATSCAFAAIPPLAEHWNGSSWSHSTPISEHATFDCTIRSRANGRYVSADPAIDRALRANAHKIGGSQRYQCVATGTRTWALKSRANDRFVTLVRGRAGASYAMLQAAANRVGPSETFTFRSVTSCSCFAIAAANAMITSAELGYTGPRYGLLRARSVGVGPWEQFDIAPADRG